MNAPLDVSMHPDGTRMVVSNLGDNTVSVLDTTSLESLATVQVGVNPHGYGECIGPGIPRLLMEMALNRLEVVRDANKGDTTAVRSPERAMGCIDAAIMAGQLALRIDLWLTTASEDIDPRRLDASLGCVVFGASGDMMMSVLMAIRQGWIIDADLTTELLAIVNTVVRANRVLAAVVIDDAIVGQTDPTCLDTAQAKLETANSLVREATVWKQIETKASLLEEAILAFRNAWETALD